MRKYKIFVLLLVGVFIHTDSNGQRIKDKRVNLSFNRLPDAPLSTDFTTYSISINSAREALSSVGITEKKLAEKYLTLRAFKKLPKGGHFHINANVNPIKIVHSKEESITTSLKDKDGNVKKITTYHRDVVYNVPITFTMEDKDGKVIEQQIYGSSAEGTKYQFKNDNKTGFRSKAELSKAWGERRTTFRTLQKKSIQKSFDTFSTLIKRKHDTSIKSVLLSIQIPAGKKVANADDFAANAAAAIKVIEAVKADVPIEAAKKDLQPIIDFWTTQKDNFSADNKKEAKVHYACLYNLAVANLVIENMEEAVTYANLAVETKKKKSATNSLKGFIESQQKMMLDKNTTTLHFALDLATATAPEGVDYKKFEPKVEVAPKVIDRTQKFAGYFITTKGDSLVGTYVFSKGLRENPGFHKQEQMKFIYDKNGLPIEKSLSPVRFRRGSFNGRTFKVIKRRAGLSVKKIHFAAEIVQSGAKMDLLQVYPMERKKDGSLADHQTLIHLKGEEGYRNVGNVANPKFINWKKGFASLFQDCEVLYAEIRVGEYGRDLASISEAIHLYNKNSCK